MERNNFRISVNVRAGYSNSGTGVLIPPEMITPDKPLNVVTLLPPAYLPYINAIMIHRVENGIAIESSYGNKILEYGTSDQYEVNDIGLSYATCDLSLFFSTW